MTFLLCLPQDEELPEDVVGAAVRLAREQGGRLLVVQVFPASRERPSPVAPAELLADSWKVASDMPEPALVGFARARRATHLFLGPVARRRWGRTILRLATGGRPALREVRPAEAGLLELNLRPRP